LKESQEGGEYDPQSGKLSVPIKRCKPGG